MKRSLSSVGIFLLSGLFLVAIARTNPQKETPVEKAVPAQSTPPTPTTPPQEQEQAQDTGGPEASGFNFNDFDLLGSANEPALDPMIETLDHPLDIFIYSLSAFIKKHRNEKINPALNVTYVRSYRAAIEEISSNPTYQHDPDIQGLKREFDATWSDAQNIVNEDQEPRRGFFDFSPPSLNEKNSAKLKARFARAGTTHKKVKTRLATLTFKDPVRQAKLEDLRRLTQSIEGMRHIGENIARELYQPFLRSKQIVWGAGTVAGTVIGGFLLYHMFKKDKKPDKLTDDVMVTPERSYIHPFMPVIRDIYQRATDCYSVPLFKLVGEKPSEETLKRFAEIANAYVHLKESDDQVALAAFLSDVFKKDYLRSTRKEKLYEGKNPIKDENGKNKIDEKTGKPRYPKEIIPYHHRVLASGRPICYDDSCGNYRIGDLSDEQVKKFTAIHNYYINDYAFECIASELACSGILEADLQELKTQNKVYDGVKKIFKRNKDSNALKLSLLSLGEKEMFFSMLEVNIQDDEDTDKNQKVSEPYQKMIKKALENDKNIDKVIAWADKYLEKAEYYKRLRFFKASFNQALAHGSIVFKPHTYYQELVWWALLHTLSKKEVRSLLETNPYQLATQNINVVLNEDDAHKESSRSESRKTLAIMDNLFFKDPVPCEKVTKALEDALTQKPLSTMSAKDKLKVIGETRSLLETNESQFIQSAKNNNKQVHGYLKNYKIAALNEAYGIIAEYAQDDTFKTLVAELEKTVKSSAPADKQVKDIEKALIDHGSDKQASNFVERGLNVGLLLWAKEAVAKGNVGKKFCNNLTAALGKSSAAEQAASIIEAMLLSWSEEAVIEWEKDGSQGELYQALKDTTDVQKIITTLQGKASLLKPGIPREKKLLYVKAYAQKLVDFAKVKANTAEKTALEEFISQKAIKLDALPTKQTIIDLINKLNLTDKDQPLKELITWAQIKKEQVSDFDATYKELSKPQVHEKARLMVKIIEKYGDKEARDIVKAYTDNPTDKGKAEAVTTIESHKAASFAHLYTQEKATIIRKMIHRNGNKMAKAELDKDDAALVTWAEMNTNKDNIAPHFDDQYTKHKVAFVRKMIDQYGTSAAKRELRKPTHELMTWIENLDNQKAIHIYEACYKDVEKAWKRSYEASRRKATNESLEVYE